MEQRRRIGRYLLCDSIAAGGMAQVHLGRLVGAAGFSKTVAIKRLHPSLAKDPEFVATILDEARLMSRINDARVVQVLDVLTDSEEVLIVMDYVPGESLAGLMRAVVARGEVVPPPIAVAVVADALHGLHAAHEAANEAGEKLGIVHRDVSPHNVLVGEDGVARVLDFGIAKARGRLAVTAEGQVKGKLAYMSPEQVQSQPVTRQADIYSTGAVLWELLAGKRLFRTDGEAALLSQLLLGATEPPSAHASGISETLDEIVMRAIHVDPAQRFETAREMAVALEDRVGIASHRRVGEWVVAMAGSTLDKRTAIRRKIETETHSADDQDAAARALPPPPASGSTPHVASSSPESTSLTLSDVANRKSGSALQDAARARRGRARGFVIGAVSLLAGGLVTGAVLMSRSKTDASGSTGQSTASAIPAGVESAPAPPPSAMAPTVSPVVSTSSSAAPTMSASAPAQPTTRKPPGPAARPPAASASAPPTATPKPAGCDPPYTVDERGIRRLKPQCN